MPTVYQPLLQAFAFFVVIFALAAVGFAVARKFRGRAAHDELDPNDLLTNFREVYERGGLSDEEFRTIKAKLASDLRAQANNDGGGGI